MAEFQSCSELPLSSLSKLLVFIFSGSKSTVLRPQGFLVLAKSCIHKWPRQEPRPCKALRAFAWRTLLRVHLVAPEGARFSLSYNTLQYISLQDSYILMVIKCIVSKNHARIWIIYRTNLYITHEPVLMLECCRSSSHHHLLHSKVRNLLNYGLSNLISPTELYFI